MPGRVWAWRIPLVLGGSLAVVGAHLGRWLGHGHPPALGCDLTLIFCGVPPARYARLQGRRAAPPAHPRVTGDHHA